MRTKSHGKPRPGSIAASLSTQTSSIPDCKATIHRKTKFDTRSHPSSSTDDSPGLSAFLKNFHPPLWQPCVPDHYLSSLNTCLIVHTALSHSEYRARAVARFRYNRLKRKRALSSILTIRDHQPVVYADKQFSYVTNIDPPIPSSSPVVCPQKSKRQKNSTKTELHTSNCFQSELSSTQRLKNKRKVLHGREYLTDISVSPRILESVSDCKHCGAKKFFHETSNLCCSDGDVTLAEISIPSELKVMLLTPCVSESRGFRVMIRAYNNHLAFTSLGLKYDKKLARRTKGLYAFRVQGQVYHWINRLAPSGDEPKNLQLYYHDTDYELKNRLASCPDLDPQILQSLLRILASNPYARFFRSLSATENLQECQIILKHNPAYNLKAYNKPSVSQVAVLLAADEDSGEITHRNIRVYKHSGESKTVQYYFGCSDPLQYPPMFPNGQSGWHEGIPKNDVKKHTKRNCILSKNYTFSPHTFTNAEQLLRAEEEGKNMYVRLLYISCLVFALYVTSFFVPAVAASRGEDSSFVSLREYYSYKFQIRANDESHVLYYGRLFQQYCVDMYVKIETQRLDFFRAKSKQEQVRQEFLQGIVDAVSSGEQEPSKIGQTIVLPPSFVGGPRYMCKKYVDAMILVQKFGKPDIFLTMTCNPNWPEIKEHLLPCELAQDRPDLTARVFHAKVEELKIELLKKCVW